MEDVATLGTQEQKSWIKLSSKTEIREAPYFCDCSRTLTKHLKLSTLGRYQCHLNGHEKRHLNQAPLGKN